MFAAASSGRYRNLRCTLCLARNYSTTIAWHTRIACTLYETSTIIVKEVVFRGTPPRRPDPLLNYS